MLGLGVTPYQKLFKKGAPNNHRCRFALTEILNDRVIVGALGTIGEVRNRPGGDARFQPDQGRNIWPKDVLIQRDRDVRQAIRRFSAQYPNSNARIIGFATGFPLQ